MHVKRFADAKPYDAPNHRNYTSLRMFGAEAGGTKGLVFGYSHFLPGGGAGPDASPPEKVYFVLRGELTVIVNGKETVLKANNSCVIEPNETREIINRGNEVCTIVVAVANSAEVTDLHHRAWPGDLDQMAGTSPAMAIIPGGDDV